MNDDDNMKLTMSIDYCGEKTLSVEITRPFDTTWPVFLNEIVQLLELSYGYSFNIQDDKGKKFGIGHHHE